LKASSIEKSKTASVIHNVTILSYVLSHKANNIAETKRYVCMHRNMIALE